MRYIKCDPQMHARALWPTPAASQARRAMASDLASQSHATRRESSGSACAHTVMPQNDMCKGKDGHASACVSALTKMPFPMNLSEVHTCKD